MLFLSKNKLFFYAKLQVFGGVGALFGHRIKRRRLIGTLNEMMAAHKNAVVIANMRQKNQPIVVPTPFR